MRININYSIRFKISSVYSKVLFILKHKIYKKK